MNRNWTGELQVTLLSAYIFWKKLYSHSFKASSEKVIIIHFEKMKAKYMKEDVSKSFFRKLAGWHLVTLLQINSSHILLEILSKCLENTCEIVFYCICWLKFCNLISGFSEVFKRFWKTSQNSQINTRSSHHETFCRKMFLKIF